MTQHLFLASTPFNIINSASLALNLSEQDTAELWLIDQPQQPSLFVQAVLAWPSSPFGCIRIVSHKAKTLKQKRQRKTMLAQLRQYYDAFPAKHIYTGNDRRIEFQALMAHSQPSAHGHYVDDGTYTYVGRTTHWLLDGVIDNAFKKLQYGNWWQQPETIGASNWVSDCHVAFPDLVVPALQPKRLHALPKNLTHSAFMQLAQQAIAATPNLQEQLANVRTLILLPHESVMNAQTLSALAKFSSQDDVSVKHHPRSESCPAEFSQLPIIPSHWPMELLLPLLNEQCRVIGDISTALLTTKWLRPEISVSAIGQEDHALNPLMKNLGITFI